jgi:hypothetical protein
MNYFHNKHLTYIGKNRYYDYISVLVLKGSNDFDIKIEYVFKINIKCL